MVQQVPYIHPIAHDIFVGFSVQVGSCGTVHAVVNKRYTITCGWKNTLAMSSCLPLQVGCYAVARIVAAVGRQHILPPFLARVHPRLGTPYISTILTGLAGALITLFTDFADLAGEVVVWGWLHHLCLAGKALL